MLLVDTKSIVNITDINDVLQFPSWTFYILKAYLILLIIVSVLGNTLVLYGSYRYNAIKMDEVSLILLQNLAIADLMLVCLWEVPSLITLMYKRWILGQIVCFVTGFIVFIPGSSEIQILTVISLYKVLSLVRPLRVCAITRTHARRCVTLIWASSAFTAMTGLAMKHYAYFDPFWLNCATSMLVDPSQFIVNIIFVTLVSMLPLLIIVGSNIIILYVSSHYSAKHGGSALPSKNALITVTLVSSMFVIAMLPVTVRTWLQIVQGEITASFFVLQGQIYYISMMCNPVIYTFTNVRFRGFIKDLTKGFPKTLSSYWGAAIRRVIKPEQRRSQPKRIPEQRRAQPKRVTADNFLNKQFESAI